MRPFQVDVCYLNLQMLDIIHFNSYDFAKEDFDEEETSALGTRSLCGDDELVMMQDEVRLAIAHGQGTH